MKKKYYWIVGIAILILLILSIFLTNLINPLDKSCNIDSDCILALTELEQCGPCDFSSPKLQCVSLKEAEELQRRRDLFLGKQALCKMCETPQILYRCVCGQNGCEKTTSCSVDSDCKTKSFSQGYACIDNQCKWVGVNP